MHRRGVDLLRSAGRAGAPQAEHGVAVQHEHMESKMKAPVTMRFQLKNDNPHSSFAYNFNLRRYSTVHKHVKGMCVVHLAGGVLRTSTRPTVNVLLLHASV